MIAQVYLLFFCMQAYRIHTQQWNVAIQIIIAGTCVHIAWNREKNGDLWAFVDLRIVFECQVWKVIMMAFYKSNKHIIPS